MGNDTNASQREMTYGERAVGLTFNPSNDQKVQEIKETYAKIIDLMAGMRTPQSDNATSNERNRLISISITEAQAAQMWAVKAVTWK